MCTVLNSFQEHDCFAALVALSFQHRSPFVFRAQVGRTSDFSFSKVIFGQPLFYYTLSLSSNYRELQAAPMVRNEQLPPPPTLSREPLIF